MRGSIRSHLVLSTFVAGILAVLIPGDATAAPDVDTMCGSGQTFTVELPGRTMPLDPSTRDLEDRRLPADSVTLPDGCDVYAVIVSGYGRNNDFDELMFYRLAKWVAEHNGYVHWSWWNNFLGEYLSRPLHIIPGTSRDDFRSKYPYPGNVVERDAWDFAQGGSGKAVPDEDFQFYDDALRVLTQIRARNPDAIVIVAGHSMGGNAVARVGYFTTLKIDLLAPIDPVGNRNLPEGQGRANQYGSGRASAVPGTEGYETGNETFNWTRWRATRDLLGWIDRDCQRNALNLCRDFDPRPFHVEYRCRTVSSALANEKRSNGPIADKHCPDLYSYRNVKFQSNIRRLYHRWQRESYFPYDWKANHRFEHASLPLRSAEKFDVSYRNYQRHITQAVAGEPRPDAPGRLLKTCDHEDEKDPNKAESFEGDKLNCRDWDGHGELIGMRGTKNRLIADDFPPAPNKKNLNPLALTADWKNGRWDRDSPWSPDVNASGAGCRNDDLECLGRVKRRRALVEMASEGKWRFEPKDPSLDLVVDDLVAIAEDLWAERHGSPGNEPDSTPPESVASFDSDPTPHGWHNADATLIISAADEDGGSGVREIAFSLSGASTGGAVVPGDAVELEITAEGTTTVEYFATDNAGNSEEPQTFEVRIDKTPPLMNASVGTPANAHGWHNTDVTVTFAASDELSGVDAVAEPLTLIDEGAEQEAVGVATDRAGNSASFGVVVNIDKTAPEISGLPGSCELRPAAHQMVKVAEVVIADALAGIATTTLDAVSSEPATGPLHGRTAPDIVISGGTVRLRAERYARQGRTYDLSALATDLAGNSAQGSAVCRVPYEQRTRWPPDTGKGDAASPAPVKPALAPRLPSPASVAAPP